MLWRRMWTFTETWVLQNSKAEKIFSFSCWGGYFQTLFSPWCGNGFKGMGRAFPPLCPRTGWDIPACRRTRVERRCGWASRAPLTSKNTGSGKVRFGIWPLLPPEQFLAPSLLMAAKERVQVKSHLNPWAASPSGKGGRGLWGVSLQHHSLMGTAGSGLILSPYVIITTRPGISITDLK